jgi:hypothetical protein
MPLACITMPSVKVPHFDGINFVSWKSQMSSSLHEMNPQVWWMVDVGLSQALEDCPQIQVQKNCLHLKAHASNALSGALSAEIKDEMKMEYGLLQRANILWKVHEQMLGSSNNKRSSSKVLGNSSSSYMHISQEEQSSIQKEEIRSASLGRPDEPVSQIRMSGFGRIETSVVEEDDCST